MIDDIIKFDIKLLVKNGNKIELEIYQKLNGFVVFSRYKDKDIDIVGKGTHRLLRNAIAHGIKNLELLHDELC